MSESFKLKCACVCLSPQIEKHVLHVLEQEADSASPSHLSPEELVYAKEWVVSACTQCYCHALHKPYQ